MNINEEKEITKRNLERAITHCMGELAVENNYCWINADFYDGIKISDCQEPIKIDGSYKYQCKLSKYLK